jgi:hypothetical protein
MQTVLPAGASCKPWRRNLKESFEGTDAVESCPTIPRLSRHFDSRRRVAACAGLALTPRRVL